MNFKIKQRPREVARPISQRCLYTVLFCREIDNSLFLLMKSVNIFQITDEEETLCK